jgi:hypothetical protein
MDKLDHWINSTVNLVKLAEKGNKSLEDIKRYVVANTVAVSALTNTVLKLLDKIDKI